MLTDDQKAKIQGYLASLSDGDLNRLPKQGNEALWKSLGYDDEDKDTWYLEYEGHEIRALVVAAIVAREDSAVGAALLRARELWTELVGISKDLAKHKLSLSFPTEDGYGGLNDGEVWSSSTKFCNPLGDWAFAVQEPKPRRR